MRRRYCIIQFAVFVAAWSVCNGLPVGAASADTELKEVRQVVKNIQARYQKTRDLQADFIQKTTIEGFSTPLTSSGRVYIKKPGRLRWDYRDPNVEEIYVDRNDVKIYVPEHKQVLVGKLTSLTASRAPLRLLQGAANLDEDFTLVPTPGSLRGAGGIPLVTLIPKVDGAMSGQTMAKVVLEVQPKTYFLKTVSIHEVTGNVSSFEFENLKANTRLRDQLFEFQVPAGVEVVEASSLGPQ